MKILFCNKYNFPFSGTEVYLFQLMALLRSHGHEVELFSMADPRGEPSRYQDQFVPHVDFKRRQSLWRRAKLAGHALYSREARIRLRRVLQEFRPEVAHVRNIYHHLSPSILWELRAQGVPVLYHINDFKLICPSYNLVAHGKACDCCRGGRFWHVLTNGCHEGVPGASAVLAAEAYLHKWLRTYEKCVTRFLAPSWFVRDKLVESGWDAERISVLYHFQEVPEAAPRRASADAPILYFGRLSPEKGLTDLLRAMQSLPNIRLQIVGDGPQRRELEQLAAELELANVDFLGQQQGKELDLLIESARFSVLPSLAYETLGKTILESYARARPVIATDLGSRRELVVHERTGLLYPPGDWKQLARDIGDLCAQPERVAEMGNAGRELVRRRHSPEAHYQALLQLYQELAGQNRLLVKQRVQQPKLRVAFIGGRGVISKYSGIESYYEEVGKRLAERGHQITVYCRNYFTPAVTEYQGMHIVRLPTIRSKHLDTLIHTILSTVHASFADYDIVHYHTLGPALFSFLPRLSGKKTVVTVQGLDGHRKKWGRFAAGVLRLGEHAAVRFPNSTMVVSRTLQDYFEARYGVRPRYIPNGTEMRPAGPRKHLGFAGLESGRYILFLGRFSPEKNCHLLVEAYQQIHSDAKLVLAGGSSYSDNYVEGLRKLASERIRLLNWVSGEALNELLSHAMLFVLPSDMEGLSLALLDAMAAGVCVVTSDVAENREVVEGVGFTFHRGSANDLARVLQFLVDHPGVRMKAAIAGRERARERYLWPTIVEQVEAEYLRVMKWEQHRTALAEAKSKAKAA